MPIYDLRCLTCDCVTEHAREYNEHGFYEAECPDCGLVNHQRMPSLFSQYMGEKVFTPMVSGGKFDTTGHAKVARIPTFKEADEYDAKVNDNIAKLPRNAGMGEVREAVRSAGNGPSMADWRSHLVKPEVKDAKKQRAEDLKRNAAKRKRAAAINRGENINIRQARLPGDPKN
jgi:hypothetical protein